MNTQTKHKLDKDWVILMKEAKNLGLDIEDVKKFLSSQSKQKDAGKQLKQ
ncbi:antirepressor [Bacillus glycinifermentans]|uniref:Anti-repressor SinI family protein n=2 Tax=Bacillus TaxID=1386 RepID=A0A0J6ER05_9BACI|nr:MULTISPECIES: anti-repressor SinI family protein [Bacillus]ATH93662.1 DNA-binding anti-repressor SinI [Bacillus glycinifermentans]KKB73933.1 antirepressor [Bacillus sp. TH008]KMM59209.1 antirepressor [Bacillus glycinifermentans]KRT90162.1 antirepressor [Bacillus glycinifermentans]MBU8788674.1 DNA-binding anti-repressor SinI [Bacillus glycinifermentans]